MPPLLRARTAPIAARATLLVAVALALAVLLAPAARAHSELVSSDPADGSTVTAAPSQVLLTFNEAVSTVGAAVVVTAPDGTRVDAGSAQVQGAELSVPLERLTTSGRYTVAYRVVSDDGHPVTGELSFTYQGGSGSPPAATSVPTPPADGTPAADGGAATAWIVAAVAVVVAIVLTWLLMRRRRT